LVVAKTNRKQILVVEQCLNRGLRQHVLCSYTDYEYTPVLYNSKYLEKVDE
jgi:hypothetical protein